jgi:hypothetical protein
MAGSTQAPQPHCGAPKAQGLTAAIAVAARSKAPSVVNISQLYRGYRPDRRFRLIANLHQLDGLDRFRR